MKINMYQNNYPIKFTSFDVCNKKIIKNTTKINPTKEDIKNIEQEMQKQIQEMGLKVIKEVKCILKKNDIQ